MASVAVGLGAWELALRASLQTLLCPHPDALIGLRAGVERDVRALAGELPDGDAARAHRVAINAAGLRGAPPRSQGEPRVLVCGDSYVAGLYSPREETLCARLEAALRAAGRSCEVMNAGVPGYGPDQVLARLSTQLETLRPALVVLVLFSGNDFGDLVRNRLVRVEGGVLRSAPPPLEPLLRARLEGRPDGLLSIAALRGLLRGPPRAPRRGPTRDEARRSLTKLLARCRAEHERWATESALTEGDLLWDHYDADLALTPDSPSARLKLSLMGAVLGEIVATCQRRDVALLTVVVPAPLDACGNEWEHLAVDPERFPAFEPTALSAHARRLAEAAGAPCLDLLPAFRRAGARALYFRWDDHWNAAGQRLAAREVAGAITARRLLDAH